MFGKKKSRPTLDDNYMDDVEDSGAYDQDDTTYDQTDTDDSYDLDDDTGFRNNNRRGGKGIGGVIVTVVVILAIVAGAVFGVITAISPSKGKCSEQLEALQAACNSQTYFELRDFISKKKSNEYNALIYATEMTDEDKEKAAAILDEDVFAGFLTRAAGAAGTSVEDVLKTMIIDPTKFSGLGKEKVVTCDVMAGAYAETLNFTFAKEGGKVVLAAVEAA